MLWKHYYSKRRDNPNALCAGAENRKCVLLTLPRFSPLHITSKPSFTDLKITHIFSQIFAFQCLIKSCLEARKSDFCRGATFFRFCASIFPRRCNSALPPQGISHPITYCRVRTKFCSNFGCAAAVHQGERQQSWNHCSGRRSLGRYSQQNGATDRQNSCREFWLPNLHGYCLLAKSRRDRSYDRLGSGGRLAWLS
jgi:hypothetical protein